MKGIYLTGVTAVAAFALPALVAVLSYLFGCINGAIATSHIFYHDDVRRHGSGNAGLTNFYRNYGAKCAPMVIAFDMLKAVGAVLLGNYFLGYLLGWGAAGKYFGALFCVIGHMFPVFYGFKGGKGILCSGTLLLFTTYFVFHNTACTVLGTCISLLVLWAHRSNIKRLLSGTESKFHFHVNAPKPGEDE